MPKRLQMTIVCLRISAGLYIAIALAVILFLCFYIKNPEGIPPDDAAILSVTGIIVAAMSIAIAIFVEIVIADLRRVRYWAWIAGLIICGIYVPSVFVVLGVLGLIGLLDAETQAAFRKQSPPGPPGGTATADYH